MIVVKFLTIILCSGLFYLGGFCFLPARRFIIPTILTGLCFWITRDVWVLTMLSTMGIFCLGYGMESPLRHCFGDGWGRGVWGFLAAITLSLGLFLTGYLAWYWFILYLGLNFTLENALKRVPQCIGDPIIGLGFGLIVLLIH